MTRLEVYKQRTNPAGTGKSRALLRHRTYLPNLHGALDHYRNADSSRSGGNFLLKKVPGTIFFRVISVTKVNIKKSKLTLFLCIREKMVIVYQKLRI